MNYSDDTPQPADWIEDIASLLPALTLCQHLGYQYLTPDEALAARHGKKHKVILDIILEQQLRKLNHISYKGQRHAFSDKNIKAAVNAISDYPYDALATTGQELLELITLGKSFEQTIDGDRKSYSIHYIDWQHPENNVYHVSDEFSVERRGSLKTRRPDMVLFVNGIPLVVVEAKRPGLKDGVKQATRAQSGHHLLKLVNDSKAEIITTVIDKFETVAHARVYFRIITAKYDLLAQCLPEWQKLRQQLNRTIELEGIATPLY